MCGSCVECECMICCKSKLVCNNCKGSLCSVECEALHDCIKKIMTIKESCKAIIGQCECIRDDEYSVEIFKYQERKIILNAILLMLNKI